jgi:hypothetical protein
MGTPGGWFARLYQNNVGLIDSGAYHGHPAYGGKLAGSDENTGWTRLTGRVTLANNMAISDAALFGAVVTTVLLCLALDSTEDTGLALRGTVTRTAVCRCQDQLGRTAQSNAPSGRASSARACGFLTIFPQGTKRRLALRTLLARATGAFC